MNYPLFPNKKPKQIVLNLLCGSLYLVSQKETKTNYLQSSLWQLIPSGSAEWETQDARFSQSHLVTLPQVSLFSVVFVVLILLLGCDVQ